jgi:polysaccharide export outer membrane protein
MMLDCFGAALVTAALLISIPAAGLAQVDTQVSGAQKSTSVSRSGTVAVTPSSAGLTLVPEDFAKLKLAPGFMVSLNVLDDSDFVGTFRIDQLGDIALPILGTIRVAGETVAEARSQLTKKLLDGGYLKDPQVNLTVVEYTAPQVTIIGEVAGPGKYPLLAPRKLVDVLALAGGTTSAAGNEVEIISGRAGAEPLLVHYSRATDPKMLADAVVHPGDTVQVKRAGIVYVLGAVIRPGGYVMQEEGTLNVLQAISLAYGTSVSASVGKVYLLRRNANGGLVQTTVPYGKIIHGESADVQLHATDVLYVPTSKFKATFASGQSVLAAVASASIFAAY